MSTAYTSRDVATNSCPAGSRPKMGQQSGSILKKNSSTRSRSTNKISNVHHNDGGSGIYWNYNIKSAKARERDAHVEEEDFRVSTLDASVALEEAGLDISGTFEYYKTDDSLTSSRRLSAKWNELISSKKKAKDVKLRRRFAEEKNSNGVPKKATRRYSSFDSFGLSVDGSRNQNRKLSSTEREAALVYKMRRALQAFASFGAESAIPDGEKEEDNNDIPGPKQARQRKRGSISIMNMVISFRDTPKNKKESTIREEETARAEPKVARKRGSISKVVESIKKKSAARSPTSVAKKAPTRVEVDEYARAATTPSGSNYYVGSSTRRGAKKKRDSIVKLAQAIKTKYGPSSPSNDSCHNMTAVLDDSGASEATSGRRHRRCRRHTTEDGIRSSAKKFSDLAAGGDGRGGANGSLRCSGKKLNRLAGINSVRREEGYKDTISSILYTHSPTGLDIDMGGEGGCNNVISSILYMHSNTSSRRATQ